MHDGRGGQEALRTEVRDHGVLALVPEMRGVLVSLHRRQGGARQVHARVLLGLGTVLESSRAEDVRGTTDGDTGTVDTRARQARRYGGTTMKELTWDELADFYKKKTGQLAKIRPMDEIYEWATKQQEIVVNEDTSLSFKGQQ